MARSRNLKIVTCSVKWDCPMILPILFIAPTDQKGRGVFTTTDIDRDTVIEISPVIVMSQDERKLLDQTLLHDYIFESGEDTNESCMPLAYIPLYIHPYHPHSDYEIHYDL